MTNSLVIVIFLEIDRQDNREVDKILETSSVYLSVIIIKSFAHTKKFIAKILSAKFWQLAMDHDIIMEDYIRGLKNLCISKLIVLDKQMLMKHTCLS